MYIEQDFVGPATLDLQANRKMHNRLLRYWPTKWVDGVEVMDNLNLYANGTVQDTDSHRRIYNILGVKIEDLKKEEWKGIDSYYLYFNVVQGTYDDISNTQLDIYIEFQAPFTEKSVPEALENDRSVWFESELSYEPLKVDSLSNALSDSEIIAKVIANPYIVEYSIEDEHVLTALALLDTNEVIFEREFRVTYRGLTDVTYTSQTSVDNTATFVKEVNIEFKFRRKPETTQLAYDAYLGTIRTAVYTSVYKAYGSVYIQLLTVYHSIAPFVDNEIIHSGHYRKDGLQSMKSKEFNKTITARIKTGYKKKKVSTWKKVVTIVVTIIIIVVAILTSPITGGGSWAMAATILTIGSLAMMGLSLIMAKKDPAWGAYIGKAANVLGIAATILGITALIQNMATKIGGEGLKQAAMDALKDQALDYTTEAGKQALKEQMKTMALSYVGTALKEMTLDNMQDMLVDFVKSVWSQTTSFNMESMLNAATKGFQAYAKYINPPADGLDEMSRQVEEQEKQLEDTTAAGLKDKIDYTFSSPFYNIYDFNEIMQAMPHRMTQGTIDDTFNKYYDGITSKVTYRGYLG